MFFSSINWKRGPFHFICPKTTMRRGMIKEQDEHMFFLLFNTNFIWMAASYQIPHGLWNIIHLSPFIATRALSTFLYSLHIFHIKHILVSRFIFFLSFFNQSYWYLPISPIVPIYIYISLLFIFCNQGSWYLPLFPGLHVASHFFFTSTVSIQKSVILVWQLFFLLNLYSLCMYNIYLYTCIYLRIKVHLYFLRAQLVCTN